MCSPSAGPGSGVPDTMAPAHSKAPPGCRCVFTRPGKCSLVKMIVITASCTEHASPETRMCSHGQRTADPGPSLMGLWGMVSSVTHRQCHQGYRAARELPEAPTFCFKAGKQQGAVWGGCGPGQHSGAQRQARGGGDSTRKKAGHRAE